MATIYKRKNGTYGASCGTTQDTGHAVHRDDAGLFSVWSVHDEDKRVCGHVTKPEAEAAIDKDWNK